MSTARQAFGHPSKRPVRPITSLTGPLKLSRDLAKVPVEAYRLPEDGRKWKSIARDRMALAEWLARHGNGDGSQIFPSTGSMTRHFGWARGKTFYLLGDLSKLALLESTEHLTREHGTRIRRMNLPAFLSRAEVQHSIAGVQDSKAGVQSNDGHNRHPTGAADSARVLAGEADCRESAESSSAALTDDDKLLELLFDTFRTDQQFPDVRRDDIERGIAVIRGRAKTPPGSLRYWLTAMRKYLRDLPYENRALSQGRELESELRVGTGPSCASPVKKKAAAG